MEKATVSNYGYHAVHIEINANCNMACTFCPYPIKDDKTTKLPMEDIKSVIDQINYASNFERDTSKDAIYGETVKNLRATVSFLAQQMQITTNNTSRPRRQRRRRRREQEQ